MSAALALVADQARAFRLARQGLLTPASDGLAAAARLLGAQAQVHSAAILQLRARAPGVDAATVRRLLDQEHRLVKLWAQRATLHLAAAADLPLIGALQGQLTQRYRRWLTRYGGLSEAQLDRLVEAIGTALGDAPLSRAELAERLVPRLGAWAAPWLTDSWGGALKLAASLGLVWHGPERGGDITFRRPDPAVAPPALAPADALMALARRYLAAFGPADARDLLKFAGTPAGPLRIALAALGDELLPVTVDGRPALALAVDEAALRAAALPADALSVLPHFDPYLLAHAETGLFLAARHRPLVYRTAGWISPVVLRQGKVVAIWQASRKGARWQVALAPLARLGQRPLRRIERRLHHLAGAFGIEEVELRLAEPGSAAR